MSWGISIIIPVYKDLEGLKRTLDCIQFPSEIEHEILICNDGNSQEIANWKPEKPNVHIVNLLEHKGSYAARNEGIKHAKFDSLLFVDADVVLKDGWFTLLKPLAERNEYIALEINVVNNKKQQLLKQFSKYEEFNCDAYWETHHFGPTACLFVKKHVFESIGMFDDRLQSGGDLEFGNRCWYGNVKMHYQQNKLVWHEPRSLSQKFRKHIRVMNGQLQLQILYPNRPFQVHKSNLNGFVYKSFQAAKSIFTPNRHIAKTVGWNSAQIMWCVFWHQMAYLGAYLIVLLFPKRSN